MSFTPNFVNRFHQTLINNSLLKTGDNVIVAVSGGSDSIALLHLLHQCDMDIELFCVYIDHGLRPDEIDEEKQFLTALTKQLGITFAYKEIDVKAFATQQKKSTEESARILRYQQLELCRRAYSCQAIAVGHTADDQVEEFYLRLIRGTGLKGLGGMNLINNNIIRPLLGETKASLTDYLKSRNLQYCHDSSNDSREFLRNKVRMDLIPLLEKQFNPTIRSVTLRTMSIIKQDDDYLDLHCSERFDELCVEKKHQTDTSTSNQLTLNVASFCKEHPSMQRRLLEKICWTMESKPSFQIISQLQDLIQSGTRGAKLHLANGLRVQKEQDDIVFTYPEGRKKVRGDKIHLQKYSCTIEQPGTYPLPGLNVSVSITREKISGGITSKITGLVLDEEKTAYPLELRPILEGEKMKPLGAPGKKKINRILNDLKIPKDKKRNYPILADENGPLAIVDLRIADRAKVTAATTTVLKLQLIDKNF